MADTVKTANVTCPSCGGTLKWNIKKQAFECESCHTPGKVETKGKIVQHSLKKYSQRITEEVSFPDESYAVCKNCGAQILFEANQTATVCPMCGSPQIDAARQVAGVPPDGIVPFKVDKADAQLAFKKWVKSRWFAPNRLKESYQQGKLDPVYLPFWTYDSDSEGRYRGRGGNYIEEEDDEGNTHTRTEWYPVSGRVSKEFDDIQICDASENASKVVEEILPYNTEGGANPYSHAYLSGVSAEHYVDGAEAGFDKADTIIKRELESMAEQEIRNRGYDTADVDHIDVDHHKVEYKHMLLPAWLSAFAYKGKQYTYMINGETGEVGGERPYSIPKIIAAVVAGLLAAFLLYTVFFSESSEEEAYVYPTTETAVVTAWDAPAPTPLDSGHLLILPEAA